MKLATGCICCGHSSLDSNPAVLMPFIATRVFNWRPVEITAGWGLRDLQAGWAYSVCNSLTCRACGHLFLDIRFDDDEMQRLYSDYRGEAYCSQREEFEPGYRARNDLLVNGDPHIFMVEDFLRGHLPFPVRILDWGGDTGLNSPFKCNRSLHHIFDISNMPPIAGAKHVSQEEALAQNYDLIVCSNVLEHLPYPKSALDDIVTLMRKDTLLYIEVPYEELMFRRASGEDTASLKRHWHEHINFYCEKSLHILLERSGLRIIDQTILNVPAGGRQFGLAARKY